MTQSVVDEPSIDEIGPVDYLVVEFPGSEFKGEILPALDELVQRGIVRVLDLVIIRKDEDGNYEGFELGDAQAGPLGEVLEFERQLADLLGEEDVVATAEALAPGSTAALLVYENLWAAPFASAVRRAGGVLVADGRVPIQSLVALLEEDGATAEEPDTTTEDQGA